MPSRAGGGFDNDRAQGSGGSFDPADTLFAVDNGPKVSPTHPHCCRRARPPGAQHRVPVCRRPVLRGYSPSQRPTLHGSHRRPHCDLTRTSAKRQQLLDAGADEVIATAEEDVPARVRRLTDGQGAHVIFGPVGETALADLVTAAAHEAQLVLYGVLDRTSTPLNVAEVLFKPVTIRGFELFEITADGPPSSPSSPPAARKAFSVRAAPQGAHRDDAGVHVGDVVTQEPRRERRAVTARELADRFGVSPRTVMRMIAEERGVYEGRSRQRRDQIIDLHRQGLKGYEIAQELSVSPGLVSTRLKEARAAGVDLTRYTTPEHGAGTGVCPSDGDG